MRNIGSEVGYVKTFLQAAQYHALDAGRRHIVAGRAQLGLARGFERLVERVDEDGNPVIGPDGQPVFDVVKDLPASQRFYAGGSNSVRGFQLDRLGVPDILTPDGSLDRRQRPGRVERRAQNPGLDGTTPARCRLSTILASSAFWTPATSLRTSAISPCRISARRRVWRAARICAGSDQAGFRLQNSAPADRRHRPA